MKVYIRFDGAGIYSVHKTFAGAKATIPKACWTLIDGKIWSNTNTVTRRGFIEEVEVVE